VALLKLPKEGTEPPVRSRRTEHPVRLRRVEAIRSEVAARTAALARHRYFDLCRQKQIGRAQVMRIIEQLY